jgi:hypothetical protein
MTIPGVGSILSPPFIAATLYAFPLDSLASSSDQALIAAALPIVSGAVRAQLADSASPINDSNIALTWRTREKSNVTLTNPRIDFWNGWIDRTITKTAQENGVGNISIIRAALVTNISGTSLNQSRATLTQLTWFKAATATQGYLYKLDGTAASASDFSAAGGKISGTGYFLTIPDGYLASSDEATGLTIEAGSSYFVQIENAAGNLKNVPTNIISLSYLGDARAPITTGEETKVFAKDWSSGAARFSGNGESAIAVLGTGPSGTRVVGIAGDSIIYGVQDSIAGGAATTGDADGALGFANRALNSARYSSVRTAIAGTKASEIYAHGGQAIRLLALRYTCAVISDMGHNDRTLPWAGAAGTGYQATYRWYWKQLRSALLGGTGRIISTDLLPQSNSTDNWATTANQTSTIGPGTTQYESINPFFAAGVFNQALGDPDAAYSINSALYAGAVANGFADIDASHTKWPEDGSPIPFAANSDRTHPTGAVHTYIGADLATHLQMLLGF